MHPKPIKFIFIYLTMALAAVIIFCLVDSSEAKPATPPGPQSVTCGTFGRGPLSAVSRRGFAALMLGFATSSNALAQMDAMAGLSNYCVTNLWAPLGQYACVVEGFYTLGTPCTCPHLNGPKKNPRPVDGTIQEPKLGRCQWQQDPGTC